MNWYIRTVKEANYVLSEPYETLEEAEIKLSRLHKNKKSSAKIITIPDIKDGLNLYKNGNYYKSIIGSSKFVYFLDNIQKPMNIYDMVTKEHLLSWFIEERLDNTKEDYCKGVKFHDISNVFDEENNTNLEENEEE